MKLERKAVTSVWHCSGSWKGSENPTINLVSSDNPGPLIPGGHSEASRDVGLPSGSLALASSTITKQKDSESPKEFHNFFRCEILDIMSSYILLIH